MAWLQVVGGFLVIFNAQGLIQSYGVFQAYYEAVLLPTESPATIAWIGSFQLFFLFSMSIMVSPLIDKGHFRLGFNGGCFLMFVSILSTSWCYKFWELLFVQGILTGIGMGMAFGSGILVLQSYFTSHLGIAAGLTSAGGSVVFAAVAGGTLVVANCIVRQGPNASNGRTQMDWAMFTDVPFLLMSAGFFLTFWGIYFSFYFIVAYAQSHLHLDNHASVTLLILMNGANLPGRLLLPLLSDRLLGPVNTIIPCIFATSVLLFTWISATSHTGITVVACFYGFFSGAVQGLYNPVIWKFADDPLKKGVRVAFVFMWISIAALTGSPIGGVIIKRENGGYLGAQLFAALTVLVGGCLMVAARYAKEGWRIVKL
ncbi:hypothetical protein HO133_005700 [Letharia lupina]|uniref:Major facilitator superfamily (MFS) profile domain-containing protein n=1 Tax=Letharia lupina TaxID=560253 RepID=A0A8H6C7G2_9LECA|nr:uncharacterized protein HO133_005700 [Letharia lupina]KAF6218353.1 hypothetical protein HO133_005700 [Letharia lupina]